MKPAGIKIEIENFFSTFPPLSHEHPEWGFPGYRVGKRWNNSWPRKVHWMPPFNCSTLHITLCFFFFILDNFREVMGFHQIWKLHQETQRQLWGGWVRKRKRKKPKKYSSMCLLGTIDWLVNIFKWRFFPIIFDVAYWTSLWRLKLQRKMSYKEEKITYSHHKIKWKKHPYHLLHHFIKTGFFTLFLNKHMVRDHFL